MSRFTQQDQIADARWEATYAAIQNEAEAILASEGEHYVRGVHYVSTDDATTARFHEAEQRVRTKGRQAIEVEVKRAQMEKQIKALFESSPECVVCNVPIESLGQASIFTPMNGQDQLVHTEGVCFEKMLLQSIGRYAGRGRGAVLKGAAS